MRSLTLRRWPRTSAEVHLQRRTLLKLGAGLPLALTLPARLAARVMSPFARVRPGERYWPSAAQWQELKTQVGGNLLEPHALFAPCVADAASAACADVAKNLRNPLMLRQQP